jgi:hypothetical protein
MARRPERTAAEHGEPRHDRGLELVAAVGFAAALCCAVPVLAAAGVFAALAGIGFRN